MRQGSDIACEPASTAAPRASATSSGSSRSAAPSSRTPSATRRRARTSSCARAGTATGSRSASRTTGPGSPRPQAVQVFERFYRGDTGGRASGSGLGLAIARELADAMHGEIELASEPGRTVFTFWLPAASAHLLSGDRVSCQDRQRSGRSPSAGYSWSVRRGPTIAVVALAAAVLGGVVALLGATVTGLTDGKTTTVYVPTIARELGAGQQRADRARDAAGRQRLQPVAHLHGALAGRRHGLRVLRQGRRAGGAGLRLRRLAEPATS